MADFRLKPTVGLIPGMTIQFAEGRWTGRSENEIGDGVAVTDEAFNSIAPLVLATCPGWTPDHRYGVYELGATACSELVQALRLEADRLRESTGEARSKANLLHGLANWLEPRCEARQPLSILGY
ncbi:hypothetical protein C7I55_19405 [Sphingomonas deserti]|uniref:Uncharacterized protein n=1 Tax=Allosphingosinicella deserti TaxID=2116704 RepID=A0A2P7QIX0_9SPHN|nr:hypothetical protein C7I55_19405 [Sphingomonas deserti]